MINLIKNELIKVFHKPGLYVLFGITVLLSIVSVILNKYITMDTVNKLNLQVEVKVEDYDLKDEIGKENYVADKSDYEFNKLLTNYKYESPEYFYLDNNAYDIIYCINRAKYVDKDEKKEQECSSQYEILVANANNFDYKKILVEEKAELIKELDAIGEEADLTEIDYVKNKMLVLDYRIENNYPKTYNTYSMELETYPDVYREYYSMDQNDKNYRNRNDLIIKKNKEKEFFEMQYKLDHKLYKTGVNNNVRNSIIYTVTGTNLLILITVIMIAGSIVAEEFNKGTIKQLLVRPFSRSKILTSKIIATLIVFILFTLCYMIADALITGIGAGGFKEVADPVIVYNYNKGMVIEENVFVYSLLSFLAILPKYLIIISFVLLVSIISTNNGVSMAAGFFLMFAATIIDSFSSAKIVSYFPTSCWDFSDYLYGGISSSIHGNLTNSIIIVIITLLFINALSYILFNKKNIKNQ